MQIEHLRFLVVEDHGFQRWEIAQSLGDMGARHVYEASDGYAALTVLQNLGEPIDIILTDLNMPGMDGMEFMRHVGEIGAPMSVVLVSGLDASLVASVGAMATSYGVTVLGMLEKPLSSERLAAVLEDYQAPTTSAGRSHATAHDISLQEIAAGLHKDELVAFFQPKVELATRRIVGVEALVRWRHPEKGMLAPGAFMRVLEASPLIDELKLQGQFLKSAQT